MGDDRAASDGRGADRVGTSRRRLPPAAVTPLRALLVFAATLATGALGFALPHFGGRIALPLLPSGIAVAALVRWGRGLWPAVFAAELAIDLLNGSSLGPSLVVACGLPAGASVTARILGRQGFDQTFSRSQDIPLFLVATATGMTLPAVLGTLAFWTSHEIGVGDWLISWLRWWSNTTVGVLLVAPLLIALRHESFDRLRSQPLYATGYLLALLVLAAGVAASPDAISAATSRPPIFVISLALIVVGTLRFGLVAASAAALALSTVAALSFTFDGGAFRGLGELGGLVLLWSFVGAMTGIGLIVTALLAERDAAAAEQLRAERRYAEVFEASPQPLWVHDPVTLGFLLVNQATERQYSYSRTQLLGMRVTDLAAPGEEHAVPATTDATARGDGEPFETRHISHDGRILEVEMWARPIDFGGHSAVLVFATDVTERKALGRALIEAIAGEQRRIGQEMHDGLGQELTGLSLSMRALATRASRERLPFADELEQLTSLISACIQSARRIVHGLSPLAGADGNLLAALAGLAETSSVGGIEVRVTTRLEAPLTLPLEARNHLFRIAQEALQNAQKHSGATRIDIEFAVRPDAVRLAILDDGKGPPDFTRHGSGLGLRTMRYRAASIGGRLSIRSRIPTGTAVLCDTPQTPATPLTRVARG